MIQEAIKNAVENIHLTREQAYEVMSAIMSGRGTPAQIGAFMVAAKLKGETEYEVAGFAQAMRDKSTKVPTRHANAIDMCGTGGDGAGTFNISTIASFVVSAAGVPVAKHGNRSVSSRCGSADLMAALGVKIDLEPERLSTCLDELNLAFLFAPALHKAMHHAIGPRREVGVRTFFNILGPLTNPAMVRRQLLGVYDPKIATLIASVLRELGSERVFVIHSDDGLDEISLAAPTQLIELNQGVVTQKHLYPSDFGFPRSNGAVRGGSPQENAEIALDVLNSKPSPALDLVIVNAAAGIVVGGGAESFREGAELARQAVASGAALKKLRQLQQFTNDVS